MSARQFVDTNVLVYVFDRDAPAKRSKARSLLKDFGADLVLSTQVLQEFYVSITRKLARPVAAPAALRATRALAALAVVQIDPPLVLAAADLSQRHQVSFWDALILKAALEAGCETLLSEDFQDGFQFEAVTVRNPFA